MLHLIHSLNASTHSTTTYSAFELLYGRRASHFLQPPEDIPSPPTFPLIHRQMQQDTWDAIQLAVTQIKAQYDRHHNNPPDIAEGDKVRRARHSHIHDWSGAFQHI